MKKEIIVKQEGERLYLRSVDVQHLKPILKLANIELHQVANFRKLKKPKYYIDLSQSFKFLQFAKSGFIITFI